VDKTQKILITNIVVTIILYFIILPIFLPFDFMNRIRVLEWASIIVLQNIVVWLLIMYVSGCFKKYKSYK
jgi:hypothetical protein